MSEHKKPKGDLGILRVGSGSATYHAQPMPSIKGEIERWVLKSAIRAVRSRGHELYNLMKEPEQNPENHLDFTLTTSNGREYLELMEVVLMSGSGGYSGVGTSYNVQEMMAHNLEHIMSKARKYGAASQPMHLLLYSTDWRFVLPPFVCRLLTSALQRQKHNFSTIMYIYPDAPSGGSLEQLFPADGQHQDNVSNNLARQYVVFGDLRRPTIEPDGSVLIPVQVPSSMTGTVTQMSPDARMWIPPVLCGCALEILSLWGDRAVQNAEGPPVSYACPVPGTIAMIKIASACSEHDHFRSDPPLDETYGGLMDGYLRREPVTEAEKLFLGLIRYIGQTFRPDTCDCVIYEIRDRTDRGGVVRRRHPLYTRKCVAHLEDSDDHRAAIENNNRKNRVVTWLKSEFSIRDENIEWDWGRDRLLLITAIALTNSQKVVAQAWCDTMIGSNKVLIEENPKEEEKG